MSPPRRRSARLASGSTPGPKPKAMPSLSSLAEEETTPSSNTGKTASNSNNSYDTVNEKPSTPATPSRSVLKPPMSEMHPSKVHPTTDANSEAWLGFRDIKSADHNRGKSAGNQAQVTPSKTGVPSTPFTFNVSRPGGETGLSNDAQRMMQDLREEAARIKTELMAKRELEKEDEIINGRKIAKARGKSGRFSAAHLAEFDKMASIENHASSYRANAPKLTPSKSALKRSPSKASLDETPKSTLKRTHSKADLNDTPSQPKSCLKRTSSKADLDPRGTPRTGNRGFLSSATKSIPTISAPAESPSPVKRVRQQIEDDASSHRPVSRDGSSIPRPKSSSTETNSLRSQSSFASLTSPTKASASRLGVAKMSQPSLTRTPSKPNLGGNLSKSASKPNLGDFGQALSKPGLGNQTKSPAVPSTASKAADLKRRIISPGRFEKVKSILRGTRTASNNPQTAIPGPHAVSQTPAPRVTEKPMPTVPFTTPRRKLFKRVGFTPDTKGGTDDVEGEVHYPNLDAILDRIPKENSAEASTPTKRPLPEPPTKMSTDDEPQRIKQPSFGPSVPGAFTFRSGQTIRFASDPPSGFGSSPGQSSIRPVRPSLPLKELPGVPGAFPESLESMGFEQDSKKRTPTKSAVDGVPHGRTNEKRARTNMEVSHPDKENQTPEKPTFVGVAHGLTNQKRARGRDATGPSHPNKENQSPVQPLPGYAHGMSNKKRARATEDHEDNVDQEGADRGGKRRRAEPVPSRGTTPKSSAAAKLARATSVSPVKKPQAIATTPSSVKKRAGMSLSRLNALAAPKRR